jgi:REP element-mobilizing transposase RayT
MANTYTSLYYHVVFSTKHRYPWITQEFESRIWAYLGGIAREKNMYALLVGGMEDHIHILLRLFPTMSISKALQLLKGNSSKWIHGTFLPLQDFKWQDGYGAFSVSKSHIPVVVNYIQCQRQHHANMNFKIEFLELLQRHEVDYDERYLWD